MYNGILKSYASDVATEVHVNVDVEHAILKGLKLPNKKKF